MRIGLGKDDITTRVDGVSKFILKTLMVIGSRSMMQKSDLLKLNCSG
jgi:hypothetical protein